MTYSSLVSEIQNLNYEEKENLKNLLEKYIIEERREYFYNNYKDSVQELKDKERKFSNNIQDLKKLLD